MSDNRPSHLTLEPSPATLYPHPIIAREGWAFSAMGVVAAAVVHWTFGPWWPLRPMPVRVAVGA